MDIRNQTQTKRSQKDNATVPIVTLTSDFGLRDYYVSAMKGVILRTAPSVRIVDLCHAIPPQSMESGAFVLQHAAREFPPSTVHCAVVDPGVGTARRALAFASRDHVWVGPDNGLLHFALQDADGSVYAIDPDRLKTGRLSATFHGRDLFAPAAAHLANGRNLSDIGEPISDPQYLLSAPFQSRVDGVDGCVIHVDHFGNLVTNIPRSAIASLGEPLHVYVGTIPHAIELKRTYAEVSPNQLLALVGSADLVEISVNKGDARRRLDAEYGTSVRIEKQSM